MRIQVLVKETSVLVPCGAGKLTVRELVDKAIVRYKQVPNKHPVDIVDVKSVRLADSGAFVALDDEVADVLEDMEMVELECKFLNDDDDETSRSLPRDTPIASSQTFTGSHLSDADHTPFTSDLSEPFMLPSMREGYTSTDLPSGRSTSQELQQRLEELDNRVVGGGVAMTPMGMPGASQEELDIVSQQPWQSQNSGSQSQEPGSPPLGRKEWSTGIDTGYATNKSQESGGFSQSQPKSQEYHTSSGHTLPNDSLGYSGNSGGEGGMTGVGSGGSMSYSSRKLSVDRVSSSTQNSSSSILPSSMGRDHGNPLSTRKDDSPQHGVKSSLKAFPTSSFDHHPHSFNSQPHDGFSPGHSHLMPGNVDHMGRVYDPMSGRGGMMGYMPSLDEGSTYDKNRMMENFKRRSMSTYGPESYPRGLYGNPSQGMSGMGGMNYQIPYGSEMYNDQRAGQRKYGNPHDSQFGPGGPPNSRMTHGYSQERVDGGMVGMRTRPPFIHRPGLEEEFSNSQGGAAMEMYLSQPTSGNYFSYDRFSNPGYGHPMMGGASGVPGYGGDPRFAMGNPLGGSLSQPGVMMSHRNPGSFSLGGGAMDRHMLHPQSSLSGLSDRMSDKMRANSIKSLDSLDCKELPTLSIDKELDDIEAEDEESGSSQFKTRNPFQRDFRKSMFRDGSLYSQWMDRVYDCDLQDEDSSDVPTFEGDVASQSVPDNPLTSLTGASSYNDSTQGFSPSSQAGRGGDLAGLGAESGEESGEDDDEFGNIHIVELHKKEEPLGIQLTHFTSAKGVDLGVYIASIAEDQFAAKSGKLQVMDRILACNGRDFTKSMSSEQVQEEFEKMLNDPLLRIAVSRGGFKTTLQKSTELDATSKYDEGGVSERATLGSAAGLESGDTPLRGAVQVEGLDEVDVASNKNKEKVEENGEGASRPSIRTVAPSAAPPQAASLSLTNTRQIGVKHRIELKRSGRGYGFGLTSRDVCTNQKGQPVYVKVIHQDGPAYLDGRLQLGDRILEVNGVDVVGLGRGEVVQLLREAREKVELLVSRQEVVEEQMNEVEATPTSGEGEESAVTVNKTVLTLSFPLHNTGPAGLGISVHSRSTGGKNGEEMGVYIQSIVPGGAAAMDNRLHRNDQVLAVNGHSLLGCSNSKALDVLKSAMASEDTVTLMVARKASQATPSMASLGEEPEEEDPGTEVGIDCPVPAVVGSASSAGGNSSNHHSTPATTRHIRSTSGVSSSAMATDSSPSIRTRSATVSSTSSPTRTRSVRSESPLTKSSLCRSQDLLGSGDELYDKLEPLPSPALPQSESSPGHTQSVLLDQAAALTFMASNPRNSISNLDSMDMTSLDVRGMFRSPSHTQQISHTPVTSQDPTPSASGDLPPPGTSRRKIPSSSSGTFSPGTGKRTSSSSLLSDMANHSHQQRTFPSNYYNDPSASTPGEVGKTDDPVRGSKRKDRNKPERGSGRAHAASGGGVLSSMSPEPGMINGFATMPRLSSPSYNSDASGPALFHSMSANPETTSHGSLENLRLSDSEVNMAFRRDNPGRISITRKTKKNPQKDLAHLRYVDTTPLIEGEKPSLVRAGSDGFLNEHAESDTDLIPNVAVGPSLGLVKSSSLESLHNVMHHHIIRDMVDDGPRGSGHRPGRRNSFRRNTVDHSYIPTMAGGMAEDEEDHRGVDVEFSLEGASMISFTKSPHNSKTKKKSFFEKVFSKKKKTTKKSKTSPESSRAAKGMEISPASLSAEERDKLMKHYTLQLRPHSNTMPQSAASRSRSNTASGQISPRMSPAPRAERASRGSDSASPKFNSLPNRYSMPMLDDYDSPGSPDEQLLATVAKV